MHGDPRACREHARRCAELAALVATPEEAFLNTLDEIDLKEPYPPEAA